MSHVEFTADPIELHLSLHRAQRQLRELRCKLREDAASFRGLASALKSFNLPKLAELCAEYAEEADEAAELANDEQAVDAV